MRNSFAPSPFAPLHVYRQGDGTTVDITDAKGASIAPFAKDPLAVKFAGDHHDLAARFYADLRNGEALNVQAVGHKEALSKVHEVYPNTAYTEKFA